MHPKCFKRPAHVCLLSFFLFLFYSIYRYSPFQTDNEWGKSLRLKTILALTCMVLE